MSLPQKGETRFIQRYFAPLAGEGGLGLCDDAAQIALPPDQRLVVSTDMLVESVHFFADDPPEKIAQKALRVNLSDLAAKGAEPHGYFLSLALPPHLRKSQAWMEAFAGGLAADQKRYCIHLMGGDTVGAPQGLALSVCAYGFVSNKGGMISRFGARAEDALYVTGSIGDSALGLIVRRASLLGEEKLDTGEQAILKILDEPARAALQARYLLPVPRLACREALRGFASAAMDVSDGLGIDAQSLAVASGVGFKIFLESLPHHRAVKSHLGLPGLRTRLLTGGDDYEILCTVRPGNTKPFEAVMRGAGVPAARIGIVEKGAGVLFLDAAGHPLKVQNPGFDHFL